MPFLAIEGITVPVAEWKRDYQVIGDSGRAFSGAYRSTRRALKRRWSISTPPLSRTDTEALLAILQGTGDAWSFNEDLYSAKGNGMSSGTGIAVSNTVSKYGGGSLQLTGDGVAASRSTSSRKIPHPGSTPYTLLAWLRSDLTAGSLKLDVREYDADDILQLDQADLTVPNDSTWAFQSGVWTAQAGTRRLEVRARIDGTPNGSAYVDNLAIIPAELSTSQINAIRDTTRAITGPPRTLATGDLFGSEQVLCEATIEGNDGQQFASGGQWQATGQTLEFQLIEV